MKIISISEVDSLIGKKLAFAHIVPYGETILLVMGRRDCRCGEPKE